MPTLTLAGAIHTALACVVIVFGAVQLLRRKGDGTHRAVGYGYVYALLVADGAAMLVFQFTGRLNILHFGVVTNIVCIALGLWPVLRTPRPANWRVTHYMWMSWSYVGVLAAAATEVVVRGVSLRYWATWATTMAVTAAVTASGYILIERNRPVVPA
jgi:uncharacterized membrane protein